MKTYLIELKAWIPQAFVADPDEPRLHADWLESITDLDWPAESNQILTAFESRHRGDGHRGYDGSHRVLAALELRWDGDEKVIVDRVHGRIDATVREWRLSVSLDLQDGDARKIVHVHEDQGRESAVAPEGAWGWASPRRAGAGAGGTRRLEFGLCLSHRNPLERAPGPSFDADLTGSIDASGGVELTLVSDAFPSFGARVLQDGREVFKEVLLDASAVPVDGAVGVRAMSAAMARQDNVVARRVPATGAIT